jgi:hypothetical protein
MFSMKLNVSFAASHHGPLHPFKDSEVAAVNLTGVHNAMTGIIENISHNMAKMCLSTTMHAPNSCSDCQ